MFRSIMQKIWKRKWLALVCLVVFLALGPYLFSRGMSLTRKVTVFENAAVQEGKFDGSQIKVIAFNIAHGRGATSSNSAEPPAEKPKRISKIADFLRAVDADIVVLNEVDFQTTWSGNQNQGRAIAAESGYRYRVEQRNMDFRLLWGSWKFGNVILSRYPITDAKIVSLPPLNWWEPWVCGTKQACVCRIQLDEQTSVRILAVHTEFRDEDVRVGASKVFNDVARESDLPLVAAGDFNSTPTGFPFCNQSANGENAMDLLLDDGPFRARPIDDPRETDFTFPSHQPKKTIDWILVTKKLGFVDYQVLNTNLSDHLPVLATIKLNPQKD